MEVLLVLVRRVHLDHVWVVHEPHDRHLRVPALRVLHVLGVLRNGFDGPPYFALLVRPAEHRAHRALADFGFFNGVVRVDVGRFRSLGAASAVTGCAQAGCCDVRVPGFERRKLASFSKVLFFFSRMS